MRTSLIDGYLFKCFNNTFIKTLFILNIFLFSVVISFYLPFPSFGLNSTSDSIKPCNCVVFRMDDIQDKWLDSGQIIPMNLFLSKNQSLSLGLIMNLINNDSKIIDKVKEGFNRGLFELDIHGFNHVDYTNLTEQEQTKSLTDANAKLNLLFKTTSHVFIPPLNVYNNDTLKAMQKNGFNIISSADYSENAFDGGKNIFNASNISMNQSNGASSIFHIPETVSFGDYFNGTWIDEPINNIIGNVTDNINKYGYAVITLQPQNFVKYQNNTLKDIIDDSRTKKLSNLIDYLISKDIHLYPFSRII